MRKSLLTIAMLLSTQAGQAMAEEAGKVTNAIDDLVICSIVYGRTSELYMEQGEAVRSRSFQQTSLAYSSVADRLSLDNFGEDVGPQYIDDRMAILITSLNKSSKEKDNGDIDVIAEWIDYCDAMGPRVQSALDKMDAEAKAEIEAYR